MITRQNEDAVSITGQIKPGQMQAIADKGIRSVICNRPDGESFGQPSFAQMQVAAQAAGIEMRYIPIIPGRAGQAEVDAFADALKTLPGPVLAYCRSGARSNAIYNAARAGAR